MKFNIARVAVLLLAFLSLALLIQAYSAYLTAAELVLPNIQALSPTALGGRLSIDVSPLLPKNEAGALALSLLAGQTQLADDLHKLLLTQASVQVRFAWIQTVAWSLVFGVSLLLVAVQSSLARRSAP